MILRIGDEPIPGYRLEQFLGKGQFGEVWKARSPGKAYAALKFLDLTGKQGRKEFRAIQRVKEIRHAHLMPITALWLLDEQGNVLNDQAMEDMGRDSTLVAQTLAVSEIADKQPKPELLVVAQLLGDKTLGDRLQECINAGETGIPVDELITYMEEAAKGIDYLNSAKHDLGSGIFAIQHCDIKPANILLTGDSVLICDFGVAQALADFAGDARSTGMVGSPAYMAPECIQQQPSSASDQYSLAVTYFELRTGKLPFSKTTFAEVMDAHRSGNLELSKLPPAERRVIKKATAVQPKKRYDSTVEMVRALRQAALGADRPAEKRSVATMIGAMVLFAACVAGGYMAMAGKGRTIQVSVEPADAILEINGETQELDHGVVQIKSQTTSQLDITVSHPPEYETYEKTIAVADLVENKIQVKLDQSAKFHIDQSDSLLKQGHFDAAVQQWSIALKVDTTGAYLVTPSVIARRPVGDKETLIAAVSQNKEWAGTVSSSGVLQLWDLHRPTITESVQLFADQTRDPWRIVLSNRWGVVTFLNGEVLIVDLTLNPPALVHTLFVKSKPAHDQVNLEQIEADISADDHWLVTTSSSVDDIGATLVHRWDLLSESPLESKTLIGRHDDSIPALAISPGGDSVFTASWDDTVWRWPLLAEDGAGAFLAKHTGDVSCLAVGSSVVAFGGEGAIDSQINSGAGGESGSEGIRSGGEPVESTFDTDGSTSAPSFDVARQHRITICRDGERCHPLPRGHSSPIEFLGLSESSIWLVSSCEDLNQSEIQAWNLGGDLTSPIVLRNGHRGVVKTICFSSNEQWLVTGGNDGQVLLWDFQDLHNPGPLRLRTSPGEIRLLTIDPTGHWLMSFESNGISIWDLDRCTLMKRACDKAGLKPIQPEETTSPLLDA